MSVLFVSRHVIRARIGSARILFATSGSGSGTLLCNLTCNLFLDFYHSKAILEADIYVGTKILSIYNVCKMQVPNCLISCVKS